MPARVGFVGAADERAGAAVAPVGGEFVGDGPPSLFTALRPDPFGQFAFRADLGIGERLVQRGVVLQPDLPPRRRHLLCEGGDRGVRRAEGILDRPVVGHLAPSASLEHMDYRTYV
ncbi:hypothetical protein ACFC06_21930 [Nocardia sp. NPDC056064]|uniref:hypothetical protein n=1 Tax=Nocardia sp. NPDC056064 TaxID=3345701 RepID=UPI0035DC2BEB